MKTNLWCSKSFNFNLQSIFQLRQIEGLLKWECHFTIFQCINWNNVRGSIVLLNKYSRTKWPLINLDLVWESDTNSSMGIFITYYKCKSQNFICLEFYIFTPCHYECESVKASLFFKSVSVLKFVFLNDVCARRRLHTNISSD